MAGIVLPPTSGPAPALPLGGPIAQCADSLLQGLREFHDRIPSATQELLREVLRFAASAEQEIAQRQVRIAELERTARVDPITGLDNRRGLEQTYARFQAACARYGEPAALVLLAIDDDSDGDTLEPALARALAIHLEGAVRRTDSVARLDARSFVVLLSRCPLTNARDKADWLVEHLNRLTLRDNARPTAIAVFAGVAQFGGGVSLDRALSAADHDLARGLGSR